MLRNNIIRIFVLHEKRPEPVSYEAATLVFHYFRQAKIHACMRPW